MQLDLSMLAPASGSSRVMQQIDCSELQDGVQPARFPLPPVADVSEHNLLSKVQCVQMFSSNYILVPLQLDSFEKEVVEYVKPNHGTTTLGFLFQGGIIIAVDSRASQGSYICKSSIFVCTLCVPKVKFPHSDSYLTLHCNSVPDGQKGN